MRWLRQPEEWGTDPVPPEHRRLRAIDLAVLWFSLGIGLLVLFAGALLVLLFGLSPFEVLLVSIAGSVIGSLMLAAAGRVGAAHGVPTMVSLRPVLGRTASWAPTALNAFQLLGWASFEFMIMGLGLTIVTGPILGPATPYVWIAALAAWVTVLALGGPLVVIRKWLERVAVWLVIGSTLWLTYVVLSNPAFPEAFFTPQSAGDRPLGLALDLVIAMPISWWPLVADYNRFAARPRDSFAGTFVGYTLSNSWFFFLGAAVLVVFGLVDPTLGPVTFIEAIVGTVLGSLVLLVIIVDETDNAFANVYSTAVSVQNIVPRARQRTLIIAVSAAGFAAGSVLASAWQGFAPLYEGFLLFIGGLFVPLLGVIVADQVVRGPYAPEAFAAASRTRPAALAAWAAGMAVYFLLAGVAFAGVPGVPISPVGASLPAFGIAALGHLAASRVFARLAPR